MGGKSTSTTSPKINQLSVQSSSLGLPITLGWGRGRIKCNLIWYNAFTAVPHTTKQAGGKGLGGSSKSTTYSYTASLIMGLCEGMVQGVRTVYRDKDVYQDHTTTLSWDGMSYGTTTDTALQQAGLSLVTGQAGQSPWGYVRSLYPDQALGYSEIAYVYAQDYALNDNAALANHSFEVDFAIQYGADGDADPKDIVSDFLANGAHGVPGWANGLLGDLGDWSIYCRANRLLLSPTLEEQQTASDILTEWTEATNSAAFWSEGVLKIRTFGDSAASDGGVTWTPDLSPEYDLTEDDFLAGDGTPVQLEIVDQSDAYNVVQVEYLDRANQYGVGIATAADNANITAFGQRKQDPVQYHCIADADIARHAAQLLLQRTLYRRDIYKFKLPWNFVRLEPMDYVTLTTSSDELQLSRQLVQIVDIDEDEDGMLAFSAEGIDVGTASAALYNAHSGSAVTVNTSVAPGSISAPILINAPSALTEMDPEVWCAAASPSPAWGGCEVWASADGVHYQKMGAIDGPARVGVSTAILADSADPDLAHTLPVDLSASKQPLDSTTAANADAGATLIYLGGELMTYQSATLTAANHYDLTALRRGLFGTAHRSHAAGEPFARLDDAIFKLSYTALNVGNTIHLKFPSFNIFRSSLEDLSTLPTYSIDLLGTGDAVDWRTVASGAEIAALAASATFFQPGEPATADSKAGDTWVDSDDPYFSQYIRIDSIVFGGDRPIFGGVSPRIAWLFTDALGAPPGTLMAGSSAEDLVKQAQDAADTAAAAMAQLDAIADDGILAANEKKAVVKDYNIILAEQAGIDAEALAYGITTDKTSYDNAVAALTTYLASLSPAYGDYGSDTAISRTAFDAAFQSVYTARQAVLNRISAIAGTVSTWNGVSGTGKPADNATAGADWSSNLASRPTELVDGRISAGLDGSGVVNANKVSTGAIQSNAVTNPSSAYSDGDMTLALSSGWNTIQSITVTSAGSPISINYSAILRQYNGGATLVLTQYKIVRGTTDLFVTPRLPVPLCSSAGAGYGFTPIAGTIADTPGSGSFTYYFQVQADLDGNSDIVASRRSLVLLETKR